MGPAHAQKAPETPAQVSADADRLFNEANRALAAGQLEQALEAFQKAFAKKPAYDIATNLAQTEMLLKRYADAANHLTFALTNAPPSLRKDKLETIHKMLAEARGKVGGLLITVTHDKAAVLLNGVLLGEGPMAREVFVEAGVEARIQVSAANCRSDERRERPPAGQTITVALAPDCRAQPAAPASAAAAPSSSSPAAASSHMSPAPPSSSASAAPSTAEPSLVPPLALGAASVLLLGAAVGFTVASNGAAEDGDAEREKLLQAGVTCKTSPASCTAFEDAVGQRDTFHTAAGWLYAGAGVAAAGALVLYLWPLEGEPTEPTKTVAPSVGPTGAAVTWTQSF